MAHLLTPELHFPIEGYRVDSTPFGKDCSYDGVHWGMHLGEDCLAPVGTEVRAAGRGRVVYSGLHPGLKEKGNWGNVIILVHKHQKTRKVFYSLYAHLGDRFKDVGDRVEASDVLGYVGEAYTLENGFWEAHLHFAIYIGVWQKEVLPGYWKTGDTRTQPQWWRVPSDFVRGYPNNFTLLQ